jgi:mono/diheme cytochrome c family protein
MTGLAVEEKPTLPARALADRRLTVAMIGGVLVLAALIVVFGAPLVLIHRQDLPLEQQYGHFAVSMAARLQAGSATNPLANNARTVAMGRDAYTGSCAQCHGAVGDGKGALGQSTYPPATDLTTHDVQEKSDAELFWITKNGLSFTAMPAYKTQYRDDAIWAIVSYVRALQQGRAIAFGPPPTGSPDEQPAGAQAAQRLPLVVTDSGLQPATLTVRAGIVELDVTNQGARGHQLVISGAGKVPFNAGRLLPTQTLRLQGTLDAGDYTVAVDPGGSTPGPVTTVTVR